MSEEEAVLSCRAGVFQHIDGSWKQIDGGSSRIWLMKHSVYVSYRVVGCREDNQEFVLNASVVPDIVYQKATAKFVQWKDEEAVYGLNFNSDEEADQFVGEFQAAIDIMASLPEDNRTEAPDTDSPLQTPKGRPVPQEEAVQSSLVPAPLANPPPPLSTPPPPSYVPPPLNTPLPPPIPGDVSNIPPPIDSPTVRKVKRKTSEKKAGTLKTKRDSEPDGKDKEPKDKSDSGPGSRELKRKSSKNLADAQKIQTEPKENTPDRRSKRDSVDAVKVKDVKEVKDKDKKRDSDEIKRKSTRDTVEMDEKNKRASKNLDSNTVTSDDKKRTMRGDKKDPNKRKSQNLSDSPANSGDYTQQANSQSAVLKMPSVGEGDSLRSRQAKEILSTETSYVASLDKLHEKWIEPLENKKMISEEDSRTLFANIGSIRIFNRNLLENLQQRMKEWDDAKTIIGDIFVQLGPFLKTYKTYCDNYDKAIAVYERIRAKKSLASFFKTAEAACGGFTLPFFLIMPVQRIPRYMLLLREIVNKTPKEHPDYANLHKALTMVAEIAEIVNKSVREAERVRMLENLIKKNFGGIEKLMEPHRQLLLEGDLTSSIKSTKKDCDYVLLFNDLIAFVGENKSQKVIESTIKFDIIWVKDSSEVSPTSFEILTPENSIVLTAADVDSKKMWYEEVDKAVKDFLLITKRNQKDNWLKEDDPETRITKFTFTEGSSYEGDWKGAKMCGKGVYKSKNGSIFDGHFDKGIMFGHGVAKYALGEEYDGEWRFDVPHGKGKLVTKNGVYDGEWETGRKSGHGTMTWENGDAYTGSWQGDVMHGKGKLTFSDGSHYEGEFKEGKRHGSGTFVSHTGSRYEGTWVDDKRSGKGKLVQISGEVYEGDFTENKKNGDGVWISATGKEKYDGEWLDDARHGKGTLTGAANYSYVGNWKDNKKYGQGKEVLPDGSSYEGTWADNKYEGTGVWIGAEGQKYEGTFHQGKKFGKGAFVDVDGSRYEGDFLHDRKEGKGKITYKNGCWYQGDWLSDLFQGQGTMVWSDGTKYQGDWQNGMRHGNGKYETALGTYEGEWKNDLRDGNGVWKGKDNSIFEGEWKENRKNGKAKFTDAAGNVSQQMWRDGIMKTPGIKHFAPDLPDSFKLL